MTELFSTSDRRDFLKTSVAVSSALAAMSIPRAVHGGAGETLKIGLIGCGNRGSGAAVDALSADPQAQLFAMGDAFEEQARSARDTIRRKSPSPSQVAVDDDRIFSGFDAYQKVIDSGVDVVILATPPTFDQRISSTRSRRESIRLSKSQSQPMCPAFTR